MMFPCKCSSFSVRVREIGVLVDERMKERVSRQIWFSVSWCSFTLLTFPFFGEGGLGRSSLYSQYCRQKTEGEESK